MIQYQQLLQRILTRGRRKKQRAVLASTGTRPECLSLFGEQMRFDLQAGFPLVTIRKISFKVVREELLWFLSGSTNVRPLQEKGIRIWDQWADEDGELGEVYGKTWRRWTQSCGQPYDQLRWLLRHIQSVKADPEHYAARRLILTAWNPPVSAASLTPTACHTFAQFDIHAGKLSCHLYQRSADMTLGVPYNIASYALLTHLLAKITGLEACELIHTFGDCHVYSNHLPQVSELLHRQPLPLPTLVLDERIQDIDGIQSEWISLENYVHHPALSGEVAI